MFVLGDNGDEPVYKVSAVTPATAAFSFTGGDSTNYITALGADGFTVGTDTRVNRSGDLYHYLAWSETPGKIGVGTYTGTGADNRNIAGVGFQPDFVMVQTGRRRQAPGCALGRDGAIDRHFALLRRARQQGRRDSSASARRFPGRHGTRGERGERRLCLRRLGASGWRPRSAWSA